MSNIIKRVWNQNKMVNIEALQGMAFQAEDGGHVFEISGVNDAGEVVPLSGTVAGVFMRPDRADIALTGSASGGVASVTLTDDCYAVPGRFGLTIFVTEGGKKTAVYAAVGTVSTTSGGVVAGDTPQDVVDLINAIAAAVATIPADYTSFMGDIANTYSPTALYPVGAYAWYNGELKCCRTAITEAETYTAEHWRNAVLGDHVSDLFDIEPIVNAIAAGGTFTFSASDFEKGTWSYTTKNDNSERIRSRFLLPIKAGTTISYITGTLKLYIGVVANRGAGAYTQNTGWIAAGSSGNYEITNDGYLVLILEGSDGVVPSDYDCTITVTSLFHKFFGVPQYDANESALLGGVREKNGGLVRVIDTGTEGSATPTSFADEIMLQKLAMAKDTNIIPLFANHRSPYTYNGITYSWVDYTTIHIEGTASAASFYSLIVSRQKLVPGINPDDEILIKIANNPDGVFLRVYKYENGSTSGTVIRDAKRDCFAKFTPATTGMMFQFYVTNGTAIATGGVDVTLEVIINPSIKHLRVLMIGNSYTNDCSAYSPLLIEELSKTTAITLGTTYYSGATIAQYNDWFDNDSAVLTYYKYNAISGRYDTAQTDRTLKQCLANEPWDIIVFQQASNLQGTWSSYATLGELISKVLGYHASVHNNPVMFGFMFPQLRYSIIDTVTFADVLNCVNNVMLNYPVSFWFPCGTAVENARATSLDSLGDAGHLCYDTLGWHLQAGLPSLIPSYVTALKLLEIAGEPWHGILVDKIRPTAEWISAINSPGENGTSTGVSYQNCLLAQKCAIAAMKYPQIIFTGGLS